MILLSERKRERILHFVQNDREKNCHCEPLKKAWQSVMNKGNGFFTSFRMTEGGRFFVAKLLRMTEICLCFPLLL